MLAVQGVLYELENTAMELECARMELEDNRSRAVQAQEALLRRVAMLSSEVLQLRRGNEEMSLENSRLQRRNDRLAEKVVSLGRIIQDMAQPKASHEQLSEGMSAGGSDLVNPGSEPTKRRKTSVSGSRASMVFTEASAAPATAEGTRGHERTSLAAGLLQSTTNDADAVDMFESQALHFRPDAPLPQVPVQQPEMHPVAKAETEKAAECLSELKIAAGVRDPLKEVGNRAMQARLTKPDAMLMEGEKADKGSRLKPPVPMPSPQLLRERPVQKRRPGEHAYQEVVRNKAERQKLKGYLCDECEGFLQACGDLVDRESLIQKCSRHRHRYAPYQTPDDFWELDFLDELKKQREREVAEQGKGKDDMAV